MTEVAARKPFAAWFVGLASALLCLSILFSSAAETEPAAARRVFLAEEAEPFPPGGDMLELYVFPLLGADSMLLSCGGRRMLVDMGKRDDAGLIRAALEGLGIKRIDAAFSTHPHEDHLGGLRPLLEYFEIGLFYTAFPEDYGGYNVVQLPAVRALNRAGVPVRRVKDGDVIPLGGAEITVLQNMGKDPNASSAVLRVTFGDTALLLAADVNRLTQSRLAAHHDLRADVLKYPHHAQEILHPDFLAAVRPEYALITHGSLDTLVAQQYLDRRQVGYLFATWGLIRLASDGQRILLSQDIRPEMSEFIEGRNQSP